MMTEFEGLKGILMMDETERIISAIPFSHSGGILFPMSAIKYGVSTVVMPKYHPLDFVKLIDKWKITGIFYGDPLCIMHYYT